MINISLSNEMSCENICKKIQNEVQGWRKENGNDLTDCILHMKIIKASHTIDTKNQQDLLLQKES